MRFSSSLSKLAFCENVNMLQKHTDSLKYMKSQHIQQLVLYFYNWINELDQALINLIQMKMQCSFKAWLTTSIYFLKLYFKK